MTYSLRLCALEHRPSALGIAIRLEPSEKGGNQARESKVEITNTLNVQKDQQPQLSLVEFQAAEGTFRQPTAAEVSILTFKLREARNHAQELSNEFARLLNRGSSLE
jgi:hypothetical protein